MCHMEHYKLRIKDPSGAEFEAEGPAEFILTEKESFLKELGRRKTGQTLPAAAEDQHETAPKADFWDKFVKSKGELLQLKIKSPEISAAETALILLAANESINQKARTSALTLSKALKISGFEPDRLDRLLSKEIKEERVTASGTKRNRTYRITHKGFERAYKAINKTPFNNE